MDERQKSQRIAATGVAVSLASLFILMRTARLIKFIGVLFSIAIGMLSGLSLLKLTIGQNLANILITEPEEFRLHTD